MNEMIIHLNEYEMMIHLNEYEMMIRLNGYEMMMNHLKTFPSHPHPCIVSGNGDGRLQSRQMDEVPSGGIRAWNLPSPQRTGPQNSCQSKEGAST